MSTLDVQPKPDPLREDSLIEEANQGNSKAFDRLILSHQTHLRRFIDRQISCKEDAADTCQEVLIKAYLKLGSFRRRSAFRTWLLSIAKHAITDYRRANRQSRILDHGHTHECSDISVEVPFVDWDSIQGICDLRQQIEHCLACILGTLSIEEQLAVILSDFYGSSNEEACRIIGKLIGAYKHLLNRARARLDMVSNDTCALARKTGYPSKCRSAAALSNLMHINSATCYEVTSGVGEHEMSKHDLSSLRTVLVRRIESLI